MRLTPPFLFLPAIGATPAAAVYLPHRCGTPCLRSASFTCAYLFAPVSLRTTAVAVSFTFYGFVHRSILHLLPLNRTQHTGCCLPACAFLRTCHRLLPFHATPVPPAVRLAGSRGHRSGLYLPPPLPFLPYTAVLLVTVYTARNTAHTCAWTLMLPVACLRAPPTPPNAVIYITVGSGRAPAMLNAAMRFWFPFSINLNGARPPLLLRAVAAGCAFACCWFGRLWADLCMPWWITARL